MLEIEFKCIFGICDVYMVGVFDCVVVVEFDVVKFVLYGLVLGDFFGVLKVVNWVI